MDLERAYDSEMQRKAMALALSQNAYGVQQPRIDIKTRWEPKDRDIIMQECEAGSFYKLGLFLDAMRSEGLIDGIMRSRTAGLFGLPVQFTGDPFLAEQLRGIDPTYDPETHEIVTLGKTGDFWQMFPLTELADLAWDGTMAGFGLGEMVPQGEGRLPRFRHLDIHWCRYDYATDQWTYQSPTGTWKIEPGDGRWIFYTPRGERRPWRKGAWFPCALPFITLATSELDRLRWQGQLADALKVIETSEKTTEPQRDEYRRFLRFGWGRSPGVVLRAGEKASLVESTGKGFEVYEQSEESAGKKIQITLAGQTVTSNGTSGWSKGNVWDDIRRDLLEDDAGAMSSCLHNQGTKRYSEVVWRRPNNVWVKWDLRSPDQKVAEAKALGEFADSIKKTDEMLRARGELTDIEVVADDYGFTLPTRPLKAPKPAPPALPQGAPLEDSDIEVEVIG
ncbi:hypothetical protein BE21_57555 [Sorangium cellulosum]|uniref:Portal protein n=1 Tax=Sorangium cellulosum TaxID=56 RepID=A0A150U394_SORCE|nr:hypothetical protein BE21_57555 [Sorangium cellulosum]